MNKVVLMQCQNKECNNLRERLEQDYSLQLKVKDLKTVHQSLEKSIQAEILSGLKCEKCDQKTDHTQRTLLGDMPSILVVCL